MGLKIHVKNLRQKQPLAWRRNKNAKKCLKGQMKGKYQGKKQKAQEGKVCRRGQNRNCK